MAGRFYVTMLQAVLLFGSETWVLTPRMDKSPKGFRHQVVQWMAGMGTKHQWDGTWVYPLIGAVLEMVELDEIKVYISF